MKKVTWIGVQPTPYNEFLYNSLKASKKIRYTFYYSKKSVKNLPFEVGKNKYTFFPSNVFGQIFLILKIGFTNDYVVLAGWSDFRRGLIILIRSVFNKKFAIWTDSVNPKKYIRDNSLKSRFKYFILNRATLIFTTGNFGVKMLKETNFVLNKKQIVSLPFFVDNNVKSKDYNNIIHHFKMVVIGRLVERKGISKYILIARELKKLNSLSKIYFAGTGPLEDTIKSEIEKYGLQNQLILLGWLDEKNLTKLKYESNILLHLVTDHDPFPLVVLESLAIGLPVIGSTLAGSVIERIKHGVNGYIVDIKNITDVTNLILQLSNNSAKLTRLSKQARLSALDWPSKRAVEIVEKSIL